MPVKKQVCVHCWAIVDPDGCPKKFGGAGKLAIRGTIGFLETLSPVLGLLVGEGTCVVYQSVCVADISSYELKNFIFRPRIHMLCLSFGYPGVIGADPILTSR